MIYKKYVFGLCPNMVPGSQLLKPLEFPVTRVIKVLFVMLMKQLLGSP